MSKKGKISIFYDAECHLCHREIEWYRKIDKLDRIDYIDISRPGFDAETYGLDKVAVNKFFHVRTGNGDYKIGVEGFPTHLGCHSFTQSFS